LSSSRTENRLPLAMFQHSALALITIYKITNLRRAPQLKASAAHPGPQTRSMIPGFSRIACATDWAPYSEPVQAIWAVAVACPGGDA
jgi:hypothetical protein